MTKEVKMTCSKYRKLILPWIDGELKPEQTNEIKAWFDSCEQVRYCNDCRKLIDEYRSFQIGFENTSPSEFPAFIHYRIMDQITSRKQVYHKKAVRARWQMVPATIAILMSLYIGSLIGIKTFNIQTTTTSESSELYSFGDNGMVSTMYSNGDVE